MKKIRIKQDKPKRKINYIAIAIILAILIAISIYFYTKNLISSLVPTISILSILIIYTIINKSLSKSYRIKKMEESFPDFIELVSSNLRAGMTIDRSILTSSRKEFFPLDDEILHLGKDITTGKEITIALYEMGERIGSEKIKKTLGIIISGIKSGGNLSILLEDTASNMRERTFVEKRAASNVLMYVIFIFFAAAVGAPVLFGLSSVLVEILTKILSNIPVVEATNLAFTLNKINISTSFINYFSITFLIAIDILASLVLGLVTKGEEKEGTKYMLPLIIIGLAIYFVIKSALAGYFAGLFSF